MGIDFVILAFATMDRFHVKGMAKHEGDSFPDTKISHPIPGEHAFCGDHDVFAVRSNDLEKIFRIGVQVLMNNNLSVTVEYAHVHLFCVQIDSAVVSVLFGVKSHPASSFGGVFVVFSQHNCTTV